MTPEQIALFATPAINLFPKAAEPIVIAPHQRELHVVADRTHDLDYEVHSLRRVRGYGDNLERRFAPFYEVTDRGAGEQGYYTFERRPRVVSSQQRRKGGPRSSYLGSEVYVTLTDPEGTRGSIPATPGGRRDVQQSRSAAAHAARRRPQPLHRRQRCALGEDHLRGRADPAAPAAGARPHVLAS